MTFAEFMRVMVKQMYVWQMAYGQSRVPSGSPQSRSAATRLTRVRRRIDDAVLQRANTIADERRCAAVLEHENPKVPVRAVRCEYQRDHGPVQGRARLTPGGTFFHDRDYDHAAPSQGLWWMEPEEAHA